MPQMAPLLIAAVAAVGGAVVSSNAQSKATNAQVGSEQAGMQVQEQMFNTERNDLAPYRAAGAGALTSLQKLLGITPGSSGPANIDFSGANGTISSLLGNSRTARGNLADPAGFFGDSMANKMGKIGDPANIIGPTIGKLFGGLATGGTAQGGATGTRVWVGERGPELVDVPAGSAIQVHNNPTSMSMAMNGGGSMMGRSAGGMVYGEPNININRPGTPVGPSRASSTMPYTSNENMQHPATITPNATGNTTNPAPFNPLAGNNTQISSMGQSPADFLKSQPEYQFVMQQGIQGLDNSAAAAGGLLTGGHMKQILNYSQGLAGNTFQSIVNNLSNVASLGSSAASMGAQVGSYSANSMSNLLSQMGASMSNGIIGQSNAQQAGLGNMATLFGMYANGGGGG